jgi:hypothetical protein
MRRPKHTHSIAIVLNGSLRSAANGKAVVGNLAWLYFGRSPFAFASAGAITFD